MNKKIVERILESINSNGRWLIVTDIAAGHRLNGIDYIMYNQMPYSSDNDSHYEIFDFEDDYLVLEYCQQNRRNNKYGTSYIYLPYERIRSIEEQINVDFYDYTLRGELC